MGKELVKRRRVWKDLTRQAIGWSTEPEDADGDRHFKAADFRVGAHVSILGNEVFLFDADSRTRKWCERNLNTSFPPNIFQAADGRLAEATGDNDNDSSCVPSPSGPEQAPTFKRGGVSLKFEARLQSPKEQLSGGCQAWVSGAANKRGRRFCLQYWPDDGSIEAQEIVQANSGFRGGTFLRRGLYYTDASKSSSAVRRTDGTMGGKVPVKAMRIGRTLSLSGNTFEILDCDSESREWLAQRKQTRRKGRTRQGRRSSEAPSSNGESATQRLMKRVCKALLGNRSRALRSRAARRFMRPGAAIPTHALRDLLATQAHIPDRKVDDVIRILGPRLGGRLTLPGFLRELRSASGFDGEGVANATQGYYG